MPKFQTRVRLARSLTRNIIGGWSGGGKWSASSRVVIGYNGRKLPFCHQVKRMCNHVSSPRTFMGAVSSSNTAQAHSLSDKEDQGECSTDYELIVFMLGSLVNPTI